MMRPSANRLRLVQRFGAPVSAAALFVFIAVAVVIHMNLETLDDEDLLSNSNDWSSINQDKPSLETLIMPRVQHSLARKEPLLSGLRETVKKGGGNRVKQVLPLANPARGRFNSQGEKGSQSESQREKFERDHPPDDMDRVKKHVEHLRLPLPKLPDDIPYDIHNCPPTPPPYYPATWLALTVLKNWNPDSTEMPDQLYQGLCIFDWESDHEKIHAYRVAEVPFLVQNNPELSRTAERWTTPGYLEKLVGADPTRNEYSANNHFMFWRTVHLRRLPPGWKAPTENVALTYAEWLGKAKAMESSPLDQTKQEHWYFRLNGAYEEFNDYLFEELPMFIPDPAHPTEFMVEPQEQRGINCRFGMKGVIAEAHFDNSRNWIVLLGGQRRYILAHPNQCVNMELYQVNHPSGRHSMVNWSNPSETGPFSKLQVNEVVLQAGDALYLPTSWFHFIVSLNINYQCNARSGVSTEYDRYIADCGFGRNG